ncbi:Hydroxyisourate hydrolase [Hyphomicrobiales bacterium]|nr:Hydroxyisourate hydrolase [Hyphomicrobiales bacterium]CAH1700469.1 5-hydroxyisourate hydrolase [Hyphomicrobiales bacterium]CAI0343650.1 5-hydroxyisourate hydrolase [Hyphomicrobiales bacterium]
MAQLITDRRRVLAAGAAVVAVPALAQAQTQQPGALTVAPVSQTGLSPRLTMHAIDTYHGLPGAGMRCDLAILDGDRYRPLKTVTTAETGRTAEPLLVDDALKAGRYELLLHLEDYFRARNAQLPTPNFLKTVPIRFVIADLGQRYHLPVLFSPWGYSYYRGS